MKRYPSLYLIADPSLYRGHRERPAPPEFFQAIAAAIEGGVQLIQYRDKTNPRGQIYETAKKIREMTRRRNISFIVNDEIDVALAVKADGVHLGQDDFPISMARSLLGKKVLIGQSTHNMAQALEAQTAGADYIGLGPIFQTPTKASDIKPLGIEAIAQIREQVTLPLYAIGGIKFSQAQAILSAGATGLAVASALAGASKETIREWIEGLNPSFSS